VPETIQELSLYDYWEILKKRRIIAIVVFVSTIISVYIFTKLTTPVYKTSATVELRIQGPSVWAFDNMMGGNYSSWMIDTETEIRKVTNLPVLSRAAVKLGILAEESTEDEKYKAANSLRDKISVKNVTNTSLLEISVTDTKPKKAVEIGEFIESQLHEVGATLQALEEKSRKFKISGKITDKVQNLGSKITSLMVERSKLLTRYSEKHPEVSRIDEQIAGLRGQMGGFTSEELEYIRLIREAKVNEILYEMLNKKLKEALITEADKVIPASIVDPARKAYLVKPNKRMNMMAGILMGIILGILGVILAENLDTSVSSSNEIESYLKCASLSEIPHIRTKKSTNLPYLLVNHEITSAYLESLNILKANIMAIERSRRVQTILFTSIMPKEGKSEALANYGIVESHNGRKTLIIDTDFRQAALHRLFRQPRKPGMIDIIVNNMDWKKVIRNVSKSAELREKTLGELGTERFDLKNLWILPVGHLPPHPMRFIGSPEFKRLTTEFKGYFDVILFDSPPLFYFADPTVLSSIVDGIVLLHKPGSATRRDLLKAKEQLSVTDPVKFMGVVLNDVKVKRKGKYYYRYYSRQHT